MKSFTRDRGPVVPFTLDESDGTIRYQEPRPEITLTGKFIPQDIAGIWMCTGGKRQIHMDRKGWRRSFWAVIVKVHRTELPDRSVQYDLDIQRRSPIVTSRSPNKRKRKKP